jgi:hypothetical protein
MHNLFGNVEDLRDAFLELVSLGRQKSATIVHQPLSLLRIATSLQCWLLSKEALLLVFSLGVERKCIDRSWKMLRSFLEDFDF